VFPKHLQTVFDYLMTHFKWSSSFVPYSNKYSVSCRHFRLTPSLLSTLGGELHGRCSFLVCFGADTTCFTSGVDGTGQFLNALSLSTSSLP